MDVPPYTGIYINLDRSQERRRDLEEQLRTYNLLSRYVRLPATDGTLLHSSRETLKPGEIGCFHSHYRALLSAQRSGLPVHILEDDVLLSEHLEGFVGKAVASKFFDNVDIIFTETYVHGNPFTLRFLKEGMDQAFNRQGQLRPNFEIRLFGLAMLELTGTTSYLVGPSSINRVLAVLKAELDAGPRMPIDYCLRAAVDNGTLKMACTMPFLTSIRLESVIESTIASPHARGAGFDIALQTLLRYSFFVKRDLEGYAMQYLCKLVDPLTEKDPHHRYITAVLDAILAGAEPNRRSHEQ